MHVQYDAHKGLAPVPKPTKNAFQALFAKHNAGCESTQVRAAYMGALRAS